MRDTPVYLLPHHRGWSNATPTSSAPPSAMAAAKLDRNPNPLNQLHHHVHRSIGNMLVSFSPPMVAPSIASAVPEYRRAAIIANVVATVP